MKSPSISIIVSTYNRPAALRAVLWSLREQHHPPSEVIVADDGSDDATREVVADAMRSADFPVLHVWQEDRGFRAAAVRNRGAAAATSDYLVLLDGDCVVTRDFVRRHAGLAKRGFFVSGTRIWLSPSLTEVVCRDKVPIHRWGWPQWLGARLRGDISRLHPFLKLPLGPLRKVGKRRWARVMTCNLGIWREEFLAVNGLDETYHGWGYEDCDLAVRLIKQGIYRKQGRYAMVNFHLWHEGAYRAEGTNRDRFERRLVSGASWAELGVDQYL